MKLLDFCKTGAGGTPLKSNKAFYDDGDIPWLLSGEVANKEITETKNFITKLGLEKSSAKLFPKNTVVVAMYGATAGEVGVLKCEASTNQAVCGIYPNDRYIPEYLYYFLLSFKSSLISQAVGNAQPNISQQKIKNIEVPLPEIDIQQQIVTKLDAAFADIDKAKQSAEQNLKKARELFDSYLQSVFGQKGDDWVDIELSKVCNFKHGFAFKSEFFVDKSDYILLTPGNFNEEGGYRDRGGKQKYYEGEFPKEFLLKKGSLLIAMTEQAKGLLGSPILVPEKGCFLHNQRLGLVELEDSVEHKIHIPFMYHFFNTRYFRNKVQETATGLKVRHTSPKKMGNISISYPCDLDIQISFSNKLDQVKSESLKLEIIYKKKLKMLDDLKQSILQKAFSGEL